MFTPIKNSCKEYTTTRNTVETFPKKSDFRQVQKTPWRELPTDVLRVVSMKKVDTKYGEATVATLIEHGGGKSMKASCQ